MKVEFVSPFAEAAVNVIEMLVNKKAERGQLVARPSIFTTQQINVLCGVTGDVEGQVIFGMSMRTANAIVSVMLGNPMGSFDQLATSAIAELGNMIAGNSLMLLSTHGYTCDITPPTILRGSNMKISTLNIPTLVIPMNIAEIGALDINVGLQEKRNYRAA